MQRVQVSCSGMETLVLESGITPDAVFRIPIGINLDLFAPPMEAQRHAVRAELGLPESATVIGSFQKDGVGWEDGLEPKLIKGPDVLLQTIERLNSEVKNLTVLLSGPARGYVKQGLSRLGIPFKHIFFKDYISLCRIYQALDLYLVTSREEGGPKSVLESMASGVPLVSTRVGQAVDLIQHGVNGWLADVEDVEGLTYWALRALSTASDLPAIRTAARRTAEANSYMVQLPLWREFFRGFVE
ncbi:MAG: glycosyl transferase family 1 [Desulfobulbaceae bacterium A2]|nr:MAG: glycosyl transferase family 1 [Desulfobulbaceae bacterium A2]